MRMLTKLLLGESGTHTDVRGLLLLTPGYFVPVLTLLDFQVRLCFALAGNPTIITGKLRGPAELRKNRWQHGGDGGETRRNHGASRQARRPRSAGSASASLTTSLEFCHASIAELKESGEGKLRATTTR